GDELRRGSEGDRGARARSPALRPRARRGERARGARAHRAAGRAASDARRLRLPRPRDGGEPRAPPERRRDAREAVRHAAPAREGGRVPRLRWTTAGESHGAALVGVLEGMPSGIELDLGRVDRELARRQKGYGRGGRMRIEKDALELLSGTRGGITLGSPVAFRIANADATIEKLPVPTNPRP